MLAASGRLMGDLTTIRMAPDRFLVFGSGYLQAWHMRWVCGAPPPAAGVTLRNLSNDWGGIAMFGPKSREALASSDRGGCQPRGVPVHDCPDDGCGSLQCPRRENVGHRRAGVRDPRAAGLPRRDLRPSDGGSAGSSDRGCGDVRAPLSQNREGIRYLDPRILAGLHAGGVWTREVHRLRQTGVHRPRRGPQRSGYGARATACPSGRGRGRRGCKLLRTDLVRRSARRLRHLSRLRSYLWQEPRDGLCFELDGQGRHTARGDHRRRAPFMPGPRRSPV